MQRALIVLPLALGLLVAACGDDDEDSTPATEPGAAESLPATDEAIALDGTTWVEGTAEGYDLAGPLTMSFQDGTVGISGGCNTMSGAYTLEADTLTAGPFAMTQMACEQALMDQDTWIAGVMEAGVTVAVDDTTLTLTGSDATITLTDQASIPPTPLEETRWELESVGTESGVTSYAAAASLVFTEGNVAVETGCNTGSGAATVTDATIEFGAIATTMRACEGPEGDLEAAILPVLQGTVEYTITGDQLTIVNGDVSLNYRAAS
jgi:heat shock protein HslJ